MASQMGFAKNYREADLTFDADGIYWVNPEDNETYQVMMGWEQPIMDKMAELCVAEGDDVLEIGFGMAILSDAIQLKKPKSHTIVECHKDIIPKLKEWAKDKSNVIVIEGLWTEVLDKYGKYDSILQDTYGDEYRHALRAIVERHSKSTCKVSYWNNESNLGFDEVEHHDVSVNPPDNKYYTKDIYKVPLVNYKS